MNALQVAEKIKNNQAWKRAYNKIIKAKNHDDRMLAYQEFENKFGINLNDRIGIYVKGFL
ncbi:hypothetical protein [Enterococcus sp. UD-01]|jgi:hypothetical protein|uniref:hypothetical protein n=1 Tax=Enterococcus sp. UD-01 TaxID=3373911 RepID=UPI003832CF8E